MNRDAALGVGAGVAVMLLFSGMLVVSRFGATSTLTVYDMAGLRFGVAGVCTLPIILRMAWPRLEIWKVLVIAATSGSPFALFLFGGMSFAPVAHGGIVINGAMPVIAAGLAWVAFGARLGPWRVVGIVMIVSGVLATGWDAMANGMPGQWRGHLLFLGAAACNATFLTTVRGWGITALQSLIIVNGVNLLLYVPLWLIFLPSNLAATPWPEIALQGVYQGIVAAFFASIMIAHAARMLGGMRQAAIMSGAPAVAVLIAIPALGEIPSSISIIGVVVVTAGILVALGPGLLSGIASPRAEKPNE
ncbi:MAG: DMT family transporter [Rhodospirillaceae bacterium]|nr:DMT family transporter [Rhodospirillaceae bacterium]MBT5945055.1 DMT family transporter [Rhodospirillaceae bacterium]MBT6402864.1 DMT family transporter [Rhodospirillaceae bacterium]MBT6535756.1 DMT family transporter [Rhodospirillaceae bacterium]MBT7360763.1 DMT family transporter [Rhodospirillaceae bacterium]